MEAMFMATWNEGKCTNGAAYKASTSCDVWSGESAGYCQGGVYRNHIRMVCPKSCGVCGDAFPTAEKVDAPAVEEPRPEAAKTEVPKSSSPTIVSPSAARQSSAHEIEQAPVRRRQVSPSAFLDLGHPSRSRGGVRRPERTATAHR